MFALLKAEMNTFPNVTSYLHADYSIYKEEHCYQKANVRQSLRKKDHVN